MRNSPDIKGRRFGRLTVIDRDLSKNSRHDALWLCVCDCGNTKSVTTGHLTCGTVKSCGCLHREISIEHFRKAASENVKHNSCGSNLYNVWNSMRQRCNNPKHPSYKYYGGKGVKICDEWNDFAEFAEWAHRNGYKVIKNVQRKDQLSIDRIDSNGDYCPNNCRWVTVHENTVRATKSRWEKAKRAT